MKTASHFDRVVEMVRRQIAALEFDRAPESQIHVLKGWRGEQKPLESYPGIVLGTDAEKYHVGNNEDDEISYPVVVVINLATGGGDDENFDDIQYIRQEIAKAFNYKREPQEGFLDDDTVVKDICYVDFGNAYLNDAWKKAWDVSHMVVWTKLRHERF